MKTLSAGRPAATASSTLAIGVAGAFIVSVAVMAFVVDDRDAGAGAIGAGWRLRGHIDDISIPPIPSHRA